jgi:hypothetical protein
MSRLIMALAIVGLFAFLPIGGMNSAFAQCEDQVSCWAANDLGDNPIAETGNYDSCDNYLNWTFKFYRNGTDNFTTTIIQYRISQANFYQNADSRDFGRYQNHQIGGKGVYVGPSNEHNLQIYRFLSGGHFENIEAIAQYYAGSGS